VTPRDINNPDWDASAIKQLCDLKNGVKSHGSLEAQFNSLWSRLVYLCSQRLQYNDGGGLMNGFQNTFLYMSADDLNEELRPFHRSLTEEYCSLALSGTLTFIVPYQGRNSTQGLEKIGNTVVRETIRKGGENAGRLSKYPAMWIMNYLLNGYPGENSAMHLSFLLGKTIEYYIGWGEGYLTRKSEILINDKTIMDMDARFARKLSRHNEIIAQAEKWRSKNRCALCGGKLDQYQHCTKCSIRRHAIDVNDGFITMYWHRKDNGFCVECGQKLNAFGKCKNQRCSIIGR